MEYNQCSFTVKDMRKLINNETWNISQKFARAHNGIDCTEAKRKVVIGMIIKSK